MRRIAVFSSNQLRVNNLVCVESFKNTFERRHVDRCSLSKFCSHSLGFAVSISARNTG